MLCQTLEPVNPVTVLTPKRAAAWAVSFMAWVARWRRPSCRRLPRFRRQDGAVARIDRITDDLVAKVVADGEAAQVMLGKQGPLTLDISRVRQGGVHIEMIVRASQFQAVVAHLPGEGCEFGQGNIGPLSGKQGDGAGHAPLPLVRKLNETGMVLLDWERGGESRCL